MAELEEVTSPSLPPAAQPKSKERDFERLHQLGYITEEEYVRAFKKSTRACWEDRKRGRGPRYITFGKNILYKITSVQAYLDSLERPQTRVPIPRMPRRVRKK